MTPFRRDCCSAYGTLVILNRVSMITLSPNCSHFLPQYMVTEYKVTHIFATVMPFTIWGNMFLNLKSLELNKPLFFLWYPALGFLLEQHQTDSRRETDERGRRWSCWSDSRGILRSSWASPLPERLFSVWIFWVRHQGESADTRKALHAGRVFSLCKGIHL